MAFSPSFGLSVLEIKITLKRSLRQTSVWPTLTIADQKIHNDKKL